MKKRTGGVGSILDTLLHIIDVEYSWIHGIQGKEDVVIEFAHYDTPEKVKSLSDKFQIEIVEFLKNIDPLKKKVVSVPWDEDQYTVEEILHHTIAHEIPHMGQLSVWSREIELSPVSANFIGRQLKSIHSF